MSQDKLQGGATGGVDELYREVILDHFKAPKNKGKLAHPNASANGMNPLCGDQISVSLLIDKDVIKDLKFEGHGCAISQSAASMLTDVVKNKPISTFREIAKGYKLMFGVSDALPASHVAGATGKETSINPDELGDLIALEGVKKYPVRIKCALLSANTIMQAVDEFLKKRGA